jgi:hypothetical protein
MCLLAGLAEGAWAHRLRLEPTVLHALGTELVRHRQMVRPVRNRLGRELRAVHRIEQADLLYEAIELLLESSLEGRLLAPKVGVPADEHAWRRRCAEEIGCALDTGVTLPGELLACAMQAQGDWQSPLELVRPLLRLRSITRHRALVVRVLLVAGRSRAAYRLLARFDLARLDSRSRAELLMALAVDTERQGRDPEAQELFERAGTCGAGPGASLGAARVALQSGRREHMTHLLERLRAECPEPARLDRALRELSERRALLGRPLEFDERWQLECMLEHATSRPAVMERS